jgi:hypothetical protein
MNNIQKIKHRALVLVAAMVLLIVASPLMRADTGTCGGASVTLPFIDVPATNLFFCSIAQAYFTGLTNGATPTTYNPSSNVSREQMSAFITRTQDSALKRANHRAFMQQWWTPGATGVLRATSTGSANQIVFDGEDLWVTTGSAVKRVHASDGKVLQTWTGATGAIAIISAAGRIFIAGHLGTSTPGKIYVINPDAAPGPVTVFEDDIAIAPFQMTFDGVNLWTNGSGAISRIDVTTGLDSTFTPGITPHDILWDGANLWVSDQGDNSLKRIDPQNGVVLESIPTGGFGTNELLFDGTNIWVDNFSNNSITIVRAVGGLRGTVLHTITGNGLDGPLGMAFDGERVLVCNYGNSVSVFKATDFTPLGTLSTGATSQPRSACYDGANFWIVRQGVNNDIVRF